MDTSILEDIGLSQGEIKVYLNLLELGTTKVGKIIEKSGMASSAVHNAVNSLIDKGLISYIKKGKIKFYKATDPKHLLNFIEDKKRSLQNLLPELLQRQKHEKEINEAEIFLGLKGIMTMLLELIKDAKRGDEYCFFSANVELMNKEIQDFFRKYDPIRKEKGLKTKGLAPLRLKEYFEDRTKRYFMSMRYTKEPLPPNMGIFKDKITLLTWGEKPVGYLIHSKQLAEIYKNFFHLLWEKYK